MTTDIIAGIACIAIALALMIFVVSSGALRRYRTRGYNEDRAYRAQLSVAEDNTDDTWAGQLNADLKADLARLQAADWAERLESEIMAWSADLQAAITGDHQPTLLIH